MRARSTFGSQARLQSGPAHDGIDTPTVTELIASRHTVSEICRFLEADSLGYISLEGLIDSVRSIERGPEGGPWAHENGGGYCHACFSGEYPILPVAGRPRHLRLVDG